MARIQPLTQDNAPAASQPLLEAVKKKMGMVPNLLGTFAQAPAALSTYLNVSETLGGGLLEAPERERVALAVGQANSCDYCLAAHTMIGKGAGLSVDETLQAREGRSADPKQAALALFAKEITENRGNVTDEQLSAFKSAGWSDAHVLEVITHVAFNTLTNYTNHIAQTQIDFPAAPELQQA